MQLTKIGVAEAHLITAVRCYFAGEHPASVYLLAASAREILTTIGDKAGIRTVLHGLAQTTGKNLRTLSATAHEHANFLKHADRDPHAVLSDLNEDHVQHILFVACHDFGRVAGGQPVELQVYEVWWFAVTYKRVLKASLRAQPLLRHCIRKFPGIRRADLAVKKQLGLQVLNEVKDDPSLIMSIDRQFDPDLARRRQEGRPQRTKSRRTV
jgi:hypothetical protein